MVSCIHLDVLNIVSVDNNFLLHRDRSKRGAASCSSTSPSFPRTCHKRSSFADFNNNMVDRGSYPDITHNSNSFGLWVFYCFVSYRFDWCQRLLLQEDLPNCSTSPNSINASQCQKRKTSFTMLYIHGFLALCDIPTILVYFLCSDTRGTIFVVIFIGRHKWHCRISEFIFESSTLLLRITEIRLTMKNILRI